MVDVLTRSLLVRPFAFLLDTPAAFPLAICGLGGIVDGIDQGQ